MSMEKKRRVEIAVCFLILFAVAVAVIYKVYYSEDGNALLFNSQGEVTGIDTQKAGRILVLPKEMDGTNIKKVEVIYCDIKALKANKATELVYLDCDSNGLVKIDLSENQELETLFCIENKLTKLDVSNNRKLTKLWCGLNELTELDVSNNLELKNLECYDNQIENLDLSNNKQLNILSCRGNNLKTIDVSQLLKLTEFGCGDNELTELDLSNNTKLKKLYCYGNNIKELDVSNNPEMEEIHVDVGTKVIGNHNAEILYYKYNEDRGMWEVAD